MHDSDDDLTLHVFGTSTNPDSIRLVLYSTSLDAVCADPTAPWFLAEWPCGDHIHTATFSAKTPFGRVPVMLQCDPMPTWVLWSCLGYLASTKTDRIAEATTLVRDSLGCDSSWPSVRHRIQSIVGRDIDASILDSVRKIISISKAR